VKLSAEEAQKAWKAGGRDGEGNTPEDVRKVLQQASAAWS
jgi:hypothetical protein